MGEIDTKSIKSVQSALSLFGEKNEPRKHWSTGSEESRKEIEFDLMLKDVANYKVQLEAKEYDYKQALLKLASYRITVDELSQKLKNTTNEKDHLIGYCRETRDQITELESKVKEMSDLLLQAENSQEQLLQTVNELKITHEELFSVKTELAAAEESKFAAMEQVELLLLAVNMEKEKTKELLEHISELNDAILLSKLAAIETEKENSTILSEKDNEIQMAAAAAAQAQEQLQEMRNQVDVMQDIDNQLLEKTLLIDYLDSGLNQAREFLSSSEIATTNAVNNIHLLKSELELMEKMNSDQSVHLRSTETEMKQLKLNFENSKEEVNHLQHEIEVLTRENQKLNFEMVEIRGKESEAQIEIELLKSELHKGRSKIAEAEAAEARAKCVNSGIYLAVKQLAIEEDNAKKETQTLKHTMEKSEVEYDDFTFVNPQIAECMQDLDLAQIEESNTQMEVKGYAFDTQITISSKEYESLMKKVKKADATALLSPSVAANVIESGNSYNLNALRSDLEAAILKIVELESVAEKAVVRAEMAERAKAAVEDQLRKWRDHQQKRRLALDGLREESSPKESKPPKYDKPAKYERTPAAYQPLGKVLNMKF